MSVHHLAFRTLDLPRALAFYRDVLGLHEVRRDGERSVWLELGHGVLMIERAADGEPAVPAGSLELVAFRVDEAERAATLSRLAAAGVTVEEATAHTSYFRDPDGRRIAVSTHPLPRDA